MREAFSESGSPAGRAPVYGMRVAVPERRTFGVRQVVPPLAAPAEPKIPLHARIAPHAEALNADWNDFCAGTLRQVENLTARLARLVARFGRLIAQAHGAGRPAAARSHSAPRIMPGEGRETLIRFLSYAGGIGALSFLAAHLLQPPSSSAVVEPAPRPDWLTIAKPYPAFLLTLPEFSEEPHYAIRRHADGGGRKDILTFGEPDRSLRYAMVEIYRPGRELEQFASAASEIAGRVRELGPAGAVRATLPLDSKFGAVKTVEFTIGRFGVGHCIGFVHEEDEPRLQISGVSCSMNTLVNRSAVACMLDRLTLMSAGSDPDIAKYFAQAEIRRNFCGQRDPILYATPKRDYPAAAPLNSLRGRFSSR